MYHIYSSPLLTAIEHHKLDAVRFLLEHGANPNLEARTRLRFCKVSPIEYAISLFCDIEIISLLLEYGANANARIVDGVVRNGTVDLLRLLLEHSANLDKRDIVQVAYDASKLDMLKLLLEYGAYPYISFRGNKGPDKEEMEALINQYQRSKRFNLMDEDVY